MHLCLLQIWILRPHITAPKPLLQKLHFPTIPACTSSEFPRVLSRALLRGNKEPELPSVPIKPRKAETGGSCPPVSNKSNQAIILISL